MKTRTKWTGPDRTGPDRTGPDRTGPDRTGPDRTGPIRCDFNGKVKKIFGCYMATKRADFEIP